MLDTNECAKQWVVKRAVWIFYGILFTSLSILEGSKYRTAFLQHIKHLDLVLLVHLDIFPERGSHA